jgi:imidazolonepropionase-like amidohydrolase
MAQSATSEALLSATRAGPDWFGQLDLYGAITPGKTADLVLLTRNPLEDITATRAIDTAVLRGRTFNRAALDAMMAKTRAQVAKWNAEAAR